MKPPVQGSGAAAKASGAAKAAAMKIGASKAFVAGGSIAAYAGRRALWPFMASGGVFAGAAWFGCFEMCWSTCRMLMPIPADVDAQARRTGLLTLPVTIGSTWWLGWRLSPPLAPPPASIADIAGAITLCKSLPVKHAAIVGMTSAATAAFTCRVVQYRGGA